ncbi:MAG: SDR family oxidoreductase [Frankiaceae bacterium]|nr:SDR family oxidoreductase [Frankiaceae bacterium]MBV9869012.1 SDR family oxidoreductase [Frankiaceae bacterium]
MSHTRPLALVTGASSGIGLELARVFAREGHDLVLVARREPELRALGDELKSRYGADSTVITADLALEGAARQLATEVADSDIEVLVNNAGLGNQGRFWETDLDADHRMLAVNVLALTELTKLLLPAMVARGSGRVLNVASTAGFQPGPFMATYYASKAYVISLTEALAEELTGTGVTATALCPGVVPTGFQAAAEMDPNTPLLKSPGSKSAEYVANAAYKGMVAGRRIVIPGVVNKIGAQAGRVTPRVVMTKVTRRLNPPA